MNHFRGDQTLIQSTQSLSFSSRYVPANIAWVAWDKVCESKDKGELGLIDIRKFNLALLGKWIWRLKSEKGGVWKDILDSKYGGWGG